MYTKKTKAQKEIVTQQNDQTHLPVRGECSKTKEMKTSDRNTKSGREPEKGSVPKQTGWLSANRNVTHSLASGQVTCSGWQTMFVTATTGVRTASGFRVHKGMNELFINVILLVQINKDLLTS